MKVAGIYLAAGKSRRMGKPKLALPVHSKTLGSIALETILKTSLEKVYVIVQDNSYNEWIPKKIKEHPSCKFLLCQEAIKGQSYSIRCGVNEAIDDQMDGVIIFLADQPLITVKMIKQLKIKFMNLKDPQYVAYYHNNIFHPPVLFSKQMYSDLLQLTGDQGAKALLIKDQFKNGVVIKSEHWKHFFDVDRKEDFKRLIALYTEQ